MRVPLSVLTLVFLISRFITSLSLTQSLFNWIQHDTDADISFAFEVLTGTVLDDWIKKNFAIWLRSADDDNCASVVLDPQVYNSARPTASIMISDPVEARTSIIEIVAFKQGMDLYPYERNLLWLSDKLQRLNWDWQGMGNGRDAGFAIGIARGGDILDSIRRRKGEKDLTWKRAMQVLRKDCCLAFHHVEVPGPGSLDGLPYVVSWKRQDLVGRT